MNLNRDSNLGPSDVLGALVSSNDPPPCSSSDSSLPSLWSPPVVSTSQSSVTVFSHTSHPHPASSDLDRAQNPEPSSISALQLPSSDPSAAASSGPRSSLHLLPGTPPSYHVSFIIPSPDLQPAPLPLPSPEETLPDLECSICFSQFNNVFRCPKMLQCHHTFCLECLARMNVKSSEPSAIQCPLCRRLTTLPTLGLPKLATDSTVLSCLPDAMQRVYSIRFVRNKGKLQVKRSAAAQQRWGHSAQPLRLTNRSLDVGLPSPPPGRPGEPGGVGGALFRLTDRPACRAFLLTAMVMMMVLLTGIIVFLLTFRESISP
ncbi:RING finger protein 223 [Salarias fasciatus]|uniref:RING finger protein 223-like n=1 Tax=Salarias fasciatus TaxID=181472 RepID=A0A672HPU5_SALFA|nr:RING finger protein 223-like [Salarias fasciatus]